MVDVPLPFLGAGGFQGRAKAGKPDIAGDELRHFPELIEIGDDLGILQVLHAGGTADKCDDFRVAGIPQQEIDKVFSRRPGGSDDQCFHLFLWLGAICAFRLDLTDDISIKDCADQIEKESGGIDILVNYAGYGSLGSVEEVPMAEARRQMEVNLFGLAALTQLAIPHMREQRWGKIINITSVGGQIAMPYGGWYHVTKFAVEGLTHSLRQELAPFDVDAILIRPGAIKTEWGNIAVENILKVSGSGPYVPAARLMHKPFNCPRVENMAADPSVIADVVEKALPVLWRCRR